MFLAPLLLVALPAQPSQLADPNFKVAVERPAYVKKHPVVVFDEAHANFHTADGRYKPLADLLASDGYRIRKGTKPFGKASLAGVDVLLISNAGSPNAAGAVLPAAFTDAECDAVRDWVRGGGALLLIADHAPYGSAAENLGKRLGVDMGKGFAFDKANSSGNPTLLVYSRENGLLGDHPILRGRGAEEEVKRVVAFTGQSLGVPEGATPLMKLSATAFEGAGRDEVRAAIDDPNGPGAHAKSVAGRAQGLALKLGKGRVVVMGEAAMFSAQVYRFTDEQGKLQEGKMGMNVDGTDDRQFALNVLHWLSGLLK